MRRLRLDKRSIAPSQPTARCALSLVRTAWEAGSVQGAVPDLSPAPRSLGWAEPARRLKRVGPRCERGAQRLLWLQSARDAGDPEGWSLRLALKRRSSKTAIHLRGRQVWVGQVPGRDVGAGLRRILQGGLKLPGCCRASGRRGHLLLEKAAGAVLLRAAFPAPRSFYAPDFFLQSTCCWLAGSPALFFLLLSH